MADQLQVVYADLLGASQTFQTQAQIYKNVIPGFIKPPSVVDSALDDAIQSTLQMISGTQETIAESIDGHGGRLWEAHRVYDQGETATTMSMNQLAQAISDPDSIR